MIPRAFLEAKVAGGSAQYKASLLGLPPNIQTRVFEYLIWPTSRSIHDVLYTYKELYKAALPLSIATYWNVDPAV